jgi:hypothetical protein
MTSKIHNLIYHVPGIEKNNVYLDGMSLLWATLTRVSLGDRYPILVDKHFLSFSSFLLITTYSSIEIQSTA